MRKIVKLFENNCVSVSGKKGRGKDLLFSNVIARRKKLDYVSNINYGYKFNEFCQGDFNCRNNFKNFITNDINFYRFPYPDKTDLYLSDCGIYFPSQVQGELCKMFDGLVTFQALSRQVGLCNVHTNSQYLGRVWDKIREQSDIYIVCQWCKVLFGKLVFQVVRIYENYDSACKNVPPFRVITPLLASGQVRSDINIAREKYYTTNGKIKTRLLIYWHKGKYDTRAFREKLLKGVRDNEKNTSKN